MALLDKSSLKQIFSGLSSIFVAKNGLTDFATLAFDFDMPVTVDTFSFTQADPSLNHTKVHGLQADWAVTSTAGDITIAATVPTIDSDLTSWFLGTGTAITAATLNGTTGWSGTSYTLKATKLYAGLGLLSEDGKSLVLIKKIALYATPVFENASTAPFAFKLTGTIEASDDAVSNNIAFLTKA